ncbi:MAG: hypothetical protein RLZZ427_1805 [Pseudomonadota bacterium]
MRNKFVPLAARIRRGPNHALLALAALAGWGCADRPALAQEWIMPAADNAPVALAVNEARVLPIPGGAAKVFVANQDVADVEGSDARRLVVFGRKRGTTSILVTTRRGIELEYTVNVGRPIEQLLANIEHLFPGNDLRVFDAPMGLTVTGSMTNAGDADKVKKMVSQYLENGETLNFNVRVVKGSQVNLHVRVVEVSRDVADTLGFNLGALITSGSTQVGILTGRAPFVADGAATATADNLFNRSVTGASSLGLKYARGGDTIGGLVDALKAQNLLRVLAEPNLTAVSGETANFLAGGQIPVPMARGSGDNQQISVEWKDFGVGLKFTPIILDPSNISIKVNSEVSELSDIGSTRMGSYSIPAITTRRIETTVNLGLGQSFAIAGLYNERSSRSLQQFPGLGSVPILGELFRSRSFKNSKTELIVIVTPYLAEPVDGIANVAVPKDAPVAGDSPLLHGPAQPAPAEPAPVQGGKVSQANPPEAEPVGEGQELPPVATVANLSERGS